MFQYIITCGYSAGVAFVVYSWLSELPLSYKFGFTALGMVIFIGTFVFQWLKMRSGDK